MERVTGVEPVTLCFNLAVQMVNLTKKRVALLDFGRPVGHAGLLLDLRSSYSLRDATDNLARLDDHFFAGLLTSHKSRLKVLAGASHPEDWQRIPAASLGTVLGVAQRNFDYVVVDCGSMYSAEWNTLARLDPILLMVAQTDVPALGEFAVKQKRFGQQLTERDFEPFKSSGRCWRGIGILDERKDERRDEWPE